MLLVSCMQYHLGVMALEQKYQIKLTNYCFLFLIDVEWFQPHQVWYILPTQAREGQTFLRVVLRGQHKGQPEEKSDLHELILEEYHSLEYWISDLNSHTETAKSWPTLAERDDWDWLFLTEGEGQAWPFLAEREGRAWPSLSMRDRQGLLSLSMVFVCFGPIFRCDSISTNRPCN